MDVKSQEPKKVRISDRTDEENFLLCMNDGIAKAHQRAEKAKRAGDSAGYYKNLSLKESLISYKESAGTEKAALESKARRNQPIFRANYVPQGVPDSQLTNHQQCMRDIEVAINNARNRADSEGVEGEFSEDVALMHSLIGYRETSIRKELGLSPAKSISAKTSAGNPSRDVLYGALILLGLLSLVILGVSLNL